VGGAKGQAASGRAVRWPGCRSRKVASRGRTNQSGRAVRQRTSRSVNRDERDEAREGETQGALAGDEDARPGRVVAGTSNEAGVRKCVRVLASQRGGSTFL